MEQDTQFRYIALELCAATLQDYVEGNYKGNESLLGGLKIAIPFNFYIPNLVPSSELIIQNQTYYDFSRFKIKQAVLS